MTSALKPYKSGDYDWSDPKIRFPKVKRRFESSYSMYIDEDLREYTEYMERIRKGLITDPALISQFVIDDLGLTLQIIFSKSYSFSTEITAQAKIQPFIFQVFIFCLELLPRGSPGVFEILQLLLSNSSKYYMYNTIYGSREIVDYLYHKYPLIFSICPLTKSVECESSSAVESSYEAELKKVLGPLNPESNMLQVQAATRVGYPGTNFIKTSCVHEKVSIVYLLNLNYFIQVGGLHALKEHMAAAKDTLMGLLPSINILDKLEKYLKEEYYQEEVLPFLMEALKMLPENLNQEEIKAAKKEDITNIFQVLKNVLKNAKNKHSVSEILTRYELEILLICLQSQIMEKRIFAITTLVEAISDAERNQENLDSLQTHNSPVKAKAGEKEEEAISQDPEPKPVETFESLHWFTRDAYLKWLEEHQVTDILLGESSHAELLRRSSPLFRFSYRNGKISFENINAICDLAIEKHDAYRKHILNILGDLAELMEIDHLQYLFGKLRSLPPQEMDQDILQLIKTIGNNTVTSDMKDEEVKFSSSKENKDAWKESIYKDNEDGTGEHIYKITINHEEARTNEDTEARRRDVENMMGSDVNEVETKVQKKKAEADEKKWADMKKKGDHLAQEMAEFLWNIVIDGKSSKGGNAQLVSSATSIMKELVSQRLKKERMNFVEKAVRAIGQNQAITESFEILQQNLNGTFPIQKHDGTLLTSKGEFIRFLESQYSITNTLFNSIILLKTDLVASLSQPSNKVHKPEASTTDKESESASSRDDSKRRLALLESAPTGSQADKDCFSIYLKEVEARIKFVRTLKSNSYDKLELRHAKLLWNILVENALYEAERDLFFTQFTSIIYCAGDEAKILSEDIINFVFFEVLLNIDFSSYTLQIFYCLEEFFKHLNKHCDLIKIEYNKFQVHSLNLIGLDFLWELYLSCPALNLVLKVQKFLLRLSTRLVEKSKSFTFIETCIRHIESAYEIVKQKESTSNDAVKRISRLLDFIFDFLQEYGELHIQRDSHNAADALQVIILNQLKGAQAPKKFNLTLYKTMTVSEAKALIASKLNPPVAPKEIVLISRGSIINTEDSGRDEIGAKVQGGQTIYCLKNNSAEETEMPAITLIGPQPAPSEDNPVTLDKIEIIQGIMPGLEIDFVKYVLKKKNWDADETVTTLLDPELVDFYNKQFETEDKQEKSNNELVPFKADAGSSGSKAAENSMSQTLSNNSDTLALFFNLLGLHIPEIEGKVWGLLSNLPLNATIYDNLRDIFQTSKFQGDLEEIDWSSLLDPTSMSKLLYSLQIINTLTSCSIMNSNDSQLPQKSQWRQDFLQKGGFSYLLNFLLQFPDTGLLKEDNSKKTAHNTEAKTIYLILNILRVYIHSALVATSSKSQRELLTETLEFPKIDKGVSTYSHSPIKEKSKPPTPTFGSPNKDFKLESAEKEKCSTNGEAADGSSTAIKEAEAPAGLVDEFEGLIKAMKEKDNDLVGRALQYFNLKDMVTKVLGVIKSSLGAIDNDKDLAALVETAFGFLLPCFVAYPKLLQVLYEYGGTGHILKMIFFENQQEQVKKKLTHMISFLSQHFNRILQTEQHLNKTISTDDTEGHERGSLVQETEENPQGHHSPGQKGKGDADAIQHAGKRPASPQDFFLKTLLPLVYSSQNSERINLEYFEMITSLIQISDRDTLSTITNLSRLYAFAIRFILDRPIIEDRSAEIEDKKLSGFLLLAKTLVKIKPSLQELFTQSLNPIVEEFALGNLDLLKTLYEFLFSLPTENEKAGASLGPPKCKNKRTRFNAFNLMRALCNNNKRNLANALKLLAMNHQKLPNFELEGPSSISSMINSELKNTTGYVGLKNLGCTCYMNSLIQQFFMIIPLRNAIMNSETKIKLKASSICVKKSNQPAENPQDQLVLLSKIDKEVYESNKKEIQTQLNDSVLYQLQILLAHLAESASEYIYPLNFFNSIKTINGEKIVLNVQQDVNEFFNTLCDKLDMCMKDTPQQSLLPELIGGLLSHEIISLEKDYPYYTEREEAYLTIPLDIKHKRDLSEALQLFIKEDILEGDNKYFCEKYDRKIKVMKRCCIKTLPNTLIITLKRFDFDFNTMQKVKINDYFEFPLSLNLKAWTIQGLRDQIPPEANYEPPEHPDSYYQYELVGVLVHSGTADGGHYYSFIKDRSGASRGWFEFNDKQVKPFDLKNIKTECFGAEGGGGSGSVYDDFDLTNIRSAYILFYERSEPEPSNIQLEYRDKGVPNSLSRAIWNENLELLRAKYFYNMDYFGFMMDLVRFHKFPIVNTVLPSYSEASRLEYMESIESQREIVVLEKSKRREEGHSNQRSQENEIKEERKDPHWKDLRVLKLALILASEIYMKNRHAEGFAEWMKMIEGVIVRFKPGAIWLIKYIIRNMDFMKLMYVDGVASTVKDASTELILKAIDDVYKIEASYFTDEQSLLIGSGHATQKIIVKKSSLARFLQLLRHNSLITKETDFSKPMEHLNLVITMVKLNEIVAHYFVQEFLLIRYFNVFIFAQKILNTLSSVSDNKKEKERYCSSNMVSMFQIIEALIRSCLTDAMYQARSLAPTYLFGKQIEWEKIPRLPEKIAKELQEHDILRRCFFPMQEKCDNFIQLAQHIAWENKEISKALISHIILQVSSIIVGVKEVDENMKVLYHLIKLEDSHQEFRVNSMFSEEGVKLMSLSRDENLILSLKKAKDNYSKAQVVLALRWLANMATEVKLVENYLHRFPEKFEWVVLFLYDLSNSKYPVFNSVSSELKTKLPHYIKKAYEIFAKIMPFWVPQDKEEVEEVEEKKDNVEIADETNNDQGVQDSPDKGPANEDVASDKGEQGDRDCDYVSEDGNGLIDEEYNSKKFS